MANYKISYWLLGILLLSLIQESCTKIKEKISKFKTDINTVFIVPTRATATAIPLDDFPPPLEFYLVRDESWSYRDGKNLYSKIIYQGKLKINPIVNFYNNILTNKNWFNIEQKAVDNYTYIKYENNENKHMAEIIIKYIPTGTQITIYVKPQ